MSTAQQRRGPWPRRSRWASAGLSIVAVLAVCGVAVAGTVRGRSEPVEERRGPTDAEVRAYVQHPDLPVVHHEEVEAGTVDDHDWGEHCDTERRYNDTEEVLARAAFPSTYAPPCVPRWGGDTPWVSQGGTTFTDNGGATSQGVTAETITVVVYLAAEQDIAKQLEVFGVLDGADTTVRGITEMAAMYDALYETYGRRVEIVPFRATGDGRSPSAARADAVRVVEMGAFASIGGPSQTSAYQLELARAGVLCLQCGYASTDDVLAEVAPHAWGYQATPDQLLFATFGLGATMLEGNPAKFAGDPALRAVPRSIGIVHYEQDPPIFGPLRDEAVSHFAARDVEATTIIQYVLDPNSLNAQAQAIVGRLKREHVTSVVFMGDPLMPRLLLQQATKQGYFPEWMFTGTAFTDASSVGRLYDQEQMAHAFGASSTAARTQPEVSEWWRLHEWWFGEAPSAPRTTLAWGPVVQILFTGIHMAGPNLTPETFAGGMFRYPPTGGTNVVGKSPLELFAGGYLEGDTTPAISFGPRDGAATDYVALDDFTIVWWDPEAKGPDEAGGHGHGLWQYTGNGLRLPLAEPTFHESVTEDFLFNEWLSGVGGPLYEEVKGLGVDDVRIAETILEATPPLNELPDYEPWPIAPARNP